MRSTGPGRIEILSGSHGPAPRRSPARPRRRWHLWSARACAIGRTRRRAPGDLGLLPGREPEMMEEGGRGGPVAPARMPGHPALDCQRRTPLMTPIVVLTCFVLAQEGVTTADGPSADRARRRRHRRLPRVRDGRCDRQAPSRRWSRSTGIKNPELAGDPGRPGAEAGPRCSRRRTGSIPGPQRPTPEDFISFDYRLRGRDRRPGGDPDRVPRRARGRPAEGPGRRAASPSTPRSSPPTRGATWP